MDEKNDYNATWKTVINQISNSSNSQDFNWWTDLSLKKTTDNNFVILAPSALIRDQIKNRYFSIIKAEMEKAFGDNVKFSIDLRPKEPGSEKNNPIEYKNEPKKPIDTPTEAAHYNINIKPEKKQQNKALQKNYTFDNYVIGENNKFAVNAALAVAKNPGKSYNPLFIYGGVGLGKTHLMQAIGNYVTEHSDSKILCVTAEKFMNEFIESINSDKKSAQAFRNKYRHTDLLMIDDIHVFKKQQESTLDELFNTYEALHNGQKQMVFTCDRPSHELTNLPERLRTRLGINVDLQPPDYETRVAIIKFKVKIEGISLPDDVISLISKNITSNIRDIEFALKRLFLCKELERKEITLPIAQEYLKDIFSTPRFSNISIETIQNVVADHYNLTTKDLRGNRKTQNIVFPRHIAMYISRELTECSTTEIGEAFGRDHSTVLNAISKTEKKLGESPSEDSNIKSLIKIIKEKSVK
ncbi:MAG: chromosomal replication initiator protein DnaA [Termitinemataceae bacterium]|nr:MAG: chromosomal replication initiator protein DnaA [Termitinemataceae bacterium]